MIPIIYPLDFTGVAPTNKLTNQTYHITQLGGTDFYQFRFKDGPVYEKYLVLKHVSTGRVLRPNIDYQLSYPLRAILPYLTADNSDNKAFACCIILNKKLSGTIIGEYQIVGGDFSTLNTNFIPAALSNAPQYQLIHYDDIVNIPDTFFPTSHTIATMELTSGFDDMVEVLWAINDSIRALEPQGRFHIDDIIGLPEELDFKVDYRRHAKVQLMDKFAITNSSLKSQIKISLPTAIDSSDLISATILVHTDYDYYRLHVRGVVAKNGTRSTAWLNPLVRIEGTNNIPPVYLTFSSQNEPTIYIGSNQLLLGKVHVAITDYTTSASTPEKQTETFKIYFTNDDLTGLVAATINRDNSHGHQLILDGDVTGQATLGQNSVTLITTVEDDSHHHSTSTIDGLDELLSGKKGLRTTVINAPAGVVNGTYYPVKIPLGDNRGADFFTISTRTSGGADAMNNCSISAHALIGGWSDTGNIFYGDFFRYQEQAIGCVASGSQGATGVIVVYVEARGFPVIVENPDNAPVPSAASSITIADSVFNASTNPFAANGTNVTTLMTFETGNGWYSNTILKPVGVQATAAARGDFRLKRLKTSVAGDDIVDFIVTDEGLDIIIDNDADSDAAAFALKRVINGALEVLFKVLPNGELYADGTNRLYHHGYETTPAKIGASPADHLHGLTLTGDATGTGNLGPTGLTLTVTVVDNSHAHVIANVSGLQSALDGKSPTNHQHVLTLNGDVAGTATLGPNGVTLTVTVYDDSHNHIIANVDGLQSALDGKSPTNHPHVLNLTGDVTGSATLGSSGVNLVATVADNSHRHVVANIDGLQELLNQSFSKAIWISNLMGMSFGTVYDMGTFTIPTTPTFAACRVTLPTFHVEPDGDGAEPGFICYVIINGMSIMTNKVWIPHDSYGNGLAFAWTPLATVQLNPNTTQVHVQIRIDEIDAMRDLRRYNGYTWLEILPHA